MKWLWFAGPLVVLLLYASICLWPTDEVRRLRDALARWIDDVLGPLVDRRGKPRNRRVRALPEAFAQMVELAGGGTRLTDAVLLPKLAYFAARAADELTASHQLTVVCKLAKPGPSLLCRPLPLVDGRPAENKGIVFDGDAEFMDAFVVEGDSAKAVGKWLRRTLRRELMELPEVWLRVEGRYLALTLYGSADEERLDELLATADALFADKGARGGKSLFGKHAATAADPESDYATYRREPRRHVESVAGAAAPTGDAAPLAPPLLRLRAALVDFGLYGLALLLVAATAGAFASFHPALLFNSPDVRVSQPWQGGWTTKGFGCFFGAEALLAGLLAYQAYLAARRGLSIGGRIFGVRARRPNGQPLGFVRGVLLRSWIFAVLPIAAAVVTASPRSLHAVLLRVPSWTTAAVAAAVLVGLGAGVALRAGGSGFHDWLAGTEVVRAPRWRLAAVQLGRTGRGVDPVAFRRIMKVAIAVAALVIVNVVARALDFDFWVY